MRYFTDRVVQHPGRVKMTPVSGQTNVYDVERQEGTVTEPGTPFNAETFNGIINAAHGFGTCTTGANVADKIVDCPGFQLFTGACISVRFNNGNTSTAATMNVNSTGAKPIRALMNDTAAPVGLWKAGEVVTLVYGGTNWLVVDGGRYSPPGRVWYGTCPTAAGGTGGNPKIVTVEDGFTLTTGATIAVKFDNASGGLGYGRDLNVNGTGAVPINVRGMTGTMLYEPWSAGEVVVFVYDGTYWQMVSPVTGNRTNISSLVTATRTGGASSSSTVTVTGSARIGNMVNTNIRVDAGAAVAAGSNIITFNLNTCGLWTGASFAGSYSVAVPAFALKPAGTDCTVNVRALGAVTASMYFSLYFTYQIED